MLWIVVGGFIGVLVTAWARASVRNFQREQAERDTKRDRVRLDRQEEALLAKLRSGERED